MKSSRDDFGAHAYIKKKGTYIERTPPPMEKKKGKKKKEKKKEEKKREEKKREVPSIDLANFDWIV